MITFDLNCSNGHQFEGWFASSADFDAQKSNGLLACPACNDGIVQKALSVPNVPRKGNQRSAPLPSVTPAAAETSADEAKALMEEGVQVAPLLFPVVPPSAKN